MQSIRPSALKDELHANSLSDIPSFIQGGPGIGKSEIVYQFAKSVNAKLYELRANLFDPVDVRGGLKVVEEVDGTYRTHYGVPEDYPDSNAQEHHVLLIDELPNAPQATQNALLQLILNKRIGTYSLPQYTTIIACGNRAQDGAAVHNVPTTVKTRFAHYEIEANIDDWCAWASKNNIDASIIGFLRYRPNLLHKVDRVESAMPTPRSWNMLSRKLPHVMDEFYAAASLVGDGPGGEYITFKRIYADLPTIEDMLERPTTTRIPDQPDQLYAIVGAVAAHGNPTNWNDLMKFVRRMPSEFQVCCIRDGIAKYPELLDEKATNDWIKNNASVLI